MNKPSPRDPIVTPAELADVLRLPPRLASPEELERHEREVREAEAELQRTRRAAAVARVEETIPERYATARLNARWLQELAGPEAMVKARAAVTAPLVVFMGPTRAGKTSLAVAMLRARNDLGARFVRAKRLGTARIQHPAGAGEAPYVEMAMRAGFVLIDELGGESMTQNDALPDVVFERHESVLPTWFTTGLDAKGVGDRFGGGVHRRIFEGAVIIKLKGPRNGA